MQALQVIVYVNGECTRQCPHCYYPNYAPMTEAMARKVANWILGVHATEGIKALKLLILGGEPLLNLQPALIIMSLLNALPGHADGKYVLFTNGDLLTEDILHTLKGFNVKIMLNPTDNSLGEIDRRMKLIKSICGGVSLAIAADETNLPRLPELAQLAVSHDGHMRINRLYHGGTIPGYVDTYGEKMHQVFDVLLRAEKPMLPNFVLESTYPLWKGPKNCHACGRWLLMVDPDGTIRTCNADLSTVCGRVDDNPPISSLVFTHRWTSRGLGECQGCAWANGGYCQGGCPYTRKLTWGHYGKATPFCRVYKTLFPRLEILKEKWLKYNGLECTISS